MKCFIIYKSAITLQLQFLKGNLQDLNWSKSQHYRILFIYVFLSFHHFQGKDNNSSNKLQAVMDMSHSNLS